MDVDFAAEFVSCSRDLEEYISAAKDFCYSHGIILRMAEDPTNQDTVRYFPFSLFPSPIPRHCYQAALDVQKDYNQLFHKVSQDYSFLKECFQSVIGVDEFSKKLWTIYETSRKHGISKPGFLEQNRSDYMIDTKSQDVGPDNNDNFHKFTLKQVEFNTMAAGCAGNGPQLVKLHRYMLSTAGHADKMDNIAGNDTAEGMAKSFLTAWKLYGNPKAVILFFVLPAETNTYDQRLMEYGIKEADPHVKVIYRTLKDIQDRGCLNKNNCLIIDDFEVAVIYQRCGYSPTHFKTQQDWDTRLLMETSRAIISPSINYHLAGTKKVQQPQVKWQIGQKLSFISAVTDPKVLAEPGVLERFLTDPESVNRVRATFTGLYSLDLTSEGDLHAANAINFPHKYVLKPQREGGGNNKFGDDIRTTLESLGRSAERSSYILMDRIHPYRFQNYPVTGCKEVELTTLVSELGIFGSLVGTGDSVQLNQCHGFLLRTKDPHVDEGGVMTGSAVLDTPYLV